MKHRQIRRAFFLVCLCLVVFLSRAFSSEMKPNEIVRLEGTITVKGFLNENTQKTEKVFVLLLKTPVDVASDDFGGPDKSVKEIQLVLYSDHKIVKNKYLKIPVILEGSLFHAHTAHHFTNVLLDVKSITRKDTGEQLRPDRPR